MFGEKRLAMAVTLMLVMVSVGGRDEGFVHLKLHLIEDYIHDWVSVKGSNKNFEPEKRLAISVTLMWVIVQVNDVGSNVGIWD